MNKRKPRNEPVPPATHVDAEHQHADSPDWRSHDARNAHVGGGAPTPHPPPPSKK
jgi:hypothetical protein